MHYISDLSHPATPSLHPNAPSRHRKKFQPFDSISCWPHPARLPLVIPAALKSGYEVWSLCPHVHESTSFFMISITHNDLKHHMSALFLSLVSKGQKDGSKYPRQTFFHPEQFTKLLIICVQFSIFFSLKGLHQHLAGADCYPETFKKINNASPWKYFPLLWMQLISRILLVWQPGSHTARCPRFPTITVNCLFLLLEDL